MAAKRWISETLFEPLGFRVSYRAERVLHEQHTKHQDLVLFENRLFGRMLMLDGAVQVAMRDEFIYHEMMAHVPILAHGRARDVLIVGGGDCGLAEEVLRHKSVRRLTQVEIDRKVIEFAKARFPEFTRPVLADPRFELVIDDGMAFVAKTDRTYDVIIVDSTDPLGPGKVLFSQRFYAGCRRCMRPGAVLVTQNGVPMLQPAELAGSMRKLRGLFADATCFIAAIPTYVGGHMAMGWASDDPKLRRVPAKTLAARHRRAGAFRTRYWTPEVQVAAFALPRFIADLVDGKSARRSRRRGR